jgi:hypothetical protein
MKKTVFLSALLYFFTNRSANTQLVNNESSIFLINSSSVMFYNIGHTEGTKGNRYLFDDWARSFVIDSKGNTNKNDSYCFNYDEISGACINSV